MKKQDYNIKTERLELKLMDVADAKDSFEILKKHPEITKYLTFLPPQKLEDTASYIRAINNVQDPSNLVWGIFLEKTFIGQIGLHDIVYKSVLQKRTHDSAELGYWLSPEFQNNGFMTESVKAVLKFGFETLNLHRVHAKHISANTESEKVLLKCGFKYLGEARDAAQFDGQWWNEKMYDLLAIDLL